jgi:sec-independent protein translocase protein TatC
MPVLFTLLTRVGLITTETLTSKRRYAIVIIFIVAAVLTPPDIVSQLSLALPMLVLFEVSVILCRWVERSAAKEQAAADAASKGTDGKTGGGGA